MKIRQGYVSNSSSSSFVLKRDDITSLQLTLIEHHSEVGEWLGIEYAEYSWRIKVGPAAVEGYTSMDNFRMREFFDAIGVDNEKVEWWHS